MIRMDKKYFGMLSNAQKNVVYNQLECEAREEVQKDPNYHLQKKKTDMFNIIIILLAQVHEQLKKERHQVNDSEWQKWANKICKHKAKWAII